MTTKLLRVLALILLCALLVYAPEILVAVSAPYPAQREARTLLRITLCCVGEDAPKALIRAVTSYQKEHNALHLRITRAAPERLDALPGPAPDIVVFEPGAAISPEALFLPLTAQEDLHDPAQGVWHGMRYARVFEGAQDSALLCAVCAGAREREAALALLDSLCVP